MKLAALFLVAMISASTVVAARAPKPTPRVLTKVVVLPVARSDDFQFRKTKLFHLSVTPPKP